MPCMSHCVRAESRTTWCDLVPEGLKACRPAWFQLVYRC